MTEIGALNRKLSSSLSVPNNTNIFWVKKGKTGHQNAVSSFVALPPALMRGGSKESSKSGLNILNSQSNAKQRFLVCETCI